MGRWSSVLLCALIACGDDGVVESGQPLIEVPASLTLVEGEGGAFVVKLAEDPHQDVTIDIVSLNSGAAVVTTTSITLSSASYVTGELVSVLGVEDDDDVINDATELELAIDGMIVARVALTVFDNDVQQLVVDPVSLTIVESAGATFNVRLARKPAAAVTVELRSNAESVATVAPAVLTFAPGDYNVPQVATVTAIADQDVADNTTTIVVGGVPETTARTLQIAVADDDVQALVLGATSVPVTEGRSAAFTVALAYDPVTPLIIALHSSEPDAVHLPATAVVFDSSNYDVPQAITVTGMEDADRTNENATVSLSGSLAGSVTIPVTDNDDVFVGGQVNMLEGKRESFPIRLANDPGPSGRTVTVDVIDGDVTVLNATLTFTSANYGTSQEVALYAPFDEASDADKSAIVRLRYADHVEQHVAVTITNRNRPSLGFTLFHETLTAGVVGWKELRFDVDTLLPGDGRIVLTFPPGYDASAATLETSNLDGSLSGGDPWLGPLQATDPSGPGGAYIPILESSDWLVVHDFRLSIPDGAAIAGIEFEVERESRNWPVVDSGVRIVKATVGQADRSKPAQWKLFEVVTYGGPTDLWGETWSETDLESSSFGIALAAQAAMPGQTGTVSVGYVTATVYLSCP